MTTRKATPEELDSMSVSLEANHSLFSTFWSLSQVMFTTSQRIPTACVVLSSKPRVIINESFWARCSVHDKQFVIMHECLHVLLRHGIRSGQEVASATPIDVNRAQDITINEMIESVFKQSRHKLTSWEVYCWVSTVFPNNLSILTTKDYLYYLRMIVGNRGVTQEPMLVDVHGDGFGAHDGQGVGAGGEGDEDDDVLPYLEDDGELDQVTTDDLVNTLDEKEKQAILSRCPVGSRLTVVQQKVIPKRVNFDAIVRGLVPRERDPKSDDEQETWASEARRFITFNGLTLPGQLSKHGPGKKLLAAVFIDVSGSCSTYVPTFNQVAEAFKYREDLFDLTLYSFDTATKKLNYNEQPRPGGGTSFRCIINTLASLPKYPDCVVIITDGDGGKCDVGTKAKEWVWLLTSGSTEASIHPQSRRFNIKDITFGGAEI